MLALCSWYSFSSPQPSRTISVMACQLNIAASGLPASSRYKTSCGTYDGLLLTALSWSLRFSSSVKNTFKNAFSSRKCLCSYIFERLHPHNVAGHSNNLDAHIQLAWHCVGTLTKSICVFHSKADVHCPRGFWLSYDFRRHALSIWRWSFRTHHFSCHSHRPTKKRVVCPRKTKETQRRNSTNTDMLRRSSMVGRTVTKMTLASMTERPTFHEIWMNKALLVICSFLLRRSRSSRCHQDPTFQIQQRAGGGVQR